MPKACIGICLLLASVVTAGAQEVVHAVSGSISSINPSAKTIQVNQDDGFLGTFRDETKAHPDLDISRKLLARLTPADKFSTKGAHVLVFYYGNDSVPTAVGLESLGPGPFTTTSGAVTKYDKRQRCISVTGGSAAAKDFTIVPTTVAETSVGVVEGYKFDPEKGEQIRVTSSAANGKDTALYIYAK